jgi:hypothetical protein
MKINSQGQSHKTFYVSNLRIFVLSKSICKNRLEKLARDKHSSLLLKLVNYKQDFLTLAQWVNFLKHFWCKFTCILRKLDIFITMLQVLFMFIKWSSLQKRLSNFCQNIFMRSVANVIKLFTVVSYDFSK